MSRDVVDRILGKGKDGRDGHQCEEAAGSKCVQAFLQWEERDPLHHLPLRELPDGFTKYNDAEEADDNGRNGRDELNVRLDEVALGCSSDLVYVYGGSDAKWNSKKQGDQ